MHLICPHPLLQLPSPVCPHLSSPPRQPQSPLMDDLGDWASHPSSPQVHVIHPLVVTPHPGGQPPSLRRLFTSVLAGLLNSLGRQVQYFTAQFKGLFQVRKLSVLVCFPTRARPKSRTGRWLGEVQKGGREKDGERAKGNKADIVERLSWFHCEKLRFSPAGIS